jgi:CMP-N,N'-diacetyllegionaminic acid synthase
MRVLAIIPARGGSKGLPGKNLRNLAGKPLIAWSIDQALACPRVTDTVVTTDSEDIAEVARAAGAQVPFLRPAELATDTAPTEPAMVHALHEMERLHGQYDAVMLLQPTSPLRLADTLTRAVDAFIASGTDSLLGVVESHAFFWQQEPVRATYDYRCRPRRQDIAPADRRFRETGSVYVTRRDPFLAESNRLAGTVSLFVMDEREGYEIDSAADFAVVEALMHEETSA